MCVFVIMLYFGSGMFRAFKALFPWGANGRGKDFKRLGLDFMSLRLCPQRGCRTLCVS